MNQPRDLNTVQQWFQAVITHPDGVDSGVASEEAQRVIEMDRAALEQIVTRSEKLSAAERIGVYANAYFARLVECLGETFPMLKRAVGGDETFGGFAFDYLQRYPSQSYTLEHLADRFPQFLAETRPDLDVEGNAPSEPNWPDFLIELARLELTIGEVFDGPGIEGRDTLDGDALRKIPAERWPEARLVTSPCLRLLRFRYPTNAWYGDARHAGKDALLDPPDASDEYVAITRRDYVVRRITLTETQYVLLDGLRRGDTLGHALARAVETTNSPDEQLALDLMQWFAEWTSAQLFQHVELTT